ncbi:hypothetical protein CAter282_1632 [Collimonas arenae]|uniref:Uncharacterized protein n=1 Tax=Collimonas arenae TaxID=279058 RepID=A0A127QH82_9BURK|nr:hypothetical protein [Collimonas arenae]AMO99513.1 hypothetical protein CAter10_1761 [Collimonas arenae]AMP09413.1 hypothetical protein CAter282_1632 [Collimonas arenae]
MTNERDLIANLTLAVIDLAGAVAQIAETMPEHTMAQVNDSLNVAVTKLEQVAVAISTVDDADGNGDPAVTGNGAECEASGS